MSDPYESYTDVKLHSMQYNTKFIHTPTNELKLNSKILFQTVCIKFDSTI